MIEQLQTIVHIYNKIWDEFGWRFDCYIINIAKYFDVIMFKIGKE